MGILDNTNVFILPIKESILVIERLPLPHTKRRNVRYICNNCSGDTEMYPNVFFEGNLYNIKQGYLPCGCGSRFRGDDRQKLLRVNRLLCEKGSTLKAVEILYDTDEFLLECKVCSSDKELYPTLRATYSLLKQGVFPCGCSDCPQWTEEQNKIRIRRECLLRDYKLLGWVGDYTGNTTKLHLKDCSTGEEWKTNNIVGFLGGADNIKYKGHKISKSKTKPDEYFHRLVAKHSNGKNMEVVSIKREGKHTYINYRCKVCSNDKYTRAGLCSGVFSLSSDKLSRETVPCRCTGNYRWTKEQRELHIKDLLLEDRAVFLGWSEYYVTCDDFFTWKCSCGVINSTSVDKFVYCGTRCVSCCNRGFNPTIPANCYIVRWFDQKHTYLKNGITNREVLKRIKSQSNKSPLSYKILYVFHNESGKLIADCEKYIKDTLDNGVCPKELLPDGYTETYYDTEENLSFMLSYLNKELGQPIYDFTKGETNEQN